MPILPGAVVLDEVLHFIQQDRGLDLAHWQITAAKFLAGVRPGDLLAIEHGTASDGSLKFAARTADRPVLSGALTRLPSPEPAA